MTGTPKGTALVTGASAGIGAQYAEQLAHRGHDLILVARSADRLAAAAERLRSETGRSVEVFAGDLTDPADLARVTARIESDSAVTLVVNNAGAAISGNAIDATADGIGQIVALNVVAAARIAVAAGRAFAARGSGQIVNIASVVVLAPEAFNGVYSGSKSFLHALSLNLAQELRDSGVTVQSVLPGLTRTEIFEGTGLTYDQFPAEAVMEARDLVAAALVGLDRGETVTVPPLQDERQWQAYEEARTALAPGLSNRDAAPRYRALVDA